jgi:tetratricopeptide (TPR) repeat protein
MWGKESSIHFEYGMFLRKLRRFDDARHQFKTAIALDESYCEAHHQLSLLLKEQFGDDEAAALHARRVLEINPNHKRR